MSDPRASLPDVILTDAGGERLLSRCPQLLVQAARGGAITCRVDCELLTVRAEVDGVATKTGHSVNREGFTIPLTGDALSPPPELAQALAVWLASLAEPLGRRMPELRQAVTP